MTSQFKELVSTNDLISLPKFTAYTRLMVDGVSSDPFSMKTFLSEILSILRRLESSQDKDTRWKGNSWKR